MVWHCLLWGSFGTWCSTALASRKTPQTFNASCKTFGCGPLTSQRLLISAESAELRRAGRPIPDVDAQIAAIARSNGLTLLSADVHFGFVSGLVVEDWSIGPSAP